jgi:hypothetical protein
MTAIRTARSAEGRFVMIANGAAQDRRLTAAARGIVLFALSLPPGTRLTARWLESQLPDGREAIRSALRNLEECGYFRRTRTAGAKGRWVWDQVISDAPLDSPTAEFPQVAPCDGMPSHGMPSDGMVSHKRLKTGSSKTGSSKTEDLKQETSGSFESEVRRTAAARYPAEPASINGHSKGARSALDLSDLDL